MPTKAVYAASPCQPSMIAPASIEMMSPSLRTVFVVRDAVDDDLVDRGADRRGEAAVPEEVRLRTVVGDHLAGDLVQILRGGARHGRLTGRRVDRGDDQPRLAHLRDLLGGLDLHHGRFAFLTVDGTVGAVLHDTAQQYGRGVPADTAAVPARDVRGVLLSASSDFLSASIARSVTSVDLAERRRS